MGYKYIDDNWFICIHKKLNKKAPGVDEIPGELLKNASENIVDVMHYLMKYICETEVITKNFCKSEIVALPK